MSRLLIIGAGWEQLELIKAAKGAGHYVIATYPSEGAAGFSLADVSIVVDSIDIQTHKDLAEEYKVDGVVSDNCDYSLFTAAVLCEQMGMKGPSIQAAFYSTNKFAQRERCRGFDINQPKYQKIIKPDQLHSFCEQVGYPVVVKPTGNRGNFGVSIVHERGELEDAYFEAVINSASREVICEEYIEGQLVTIDGFNFQGSHKTLALAYNESNPGKYPVNASISYANELFTIHDKRLSDFHEVVVGTLGYDFGHTHGEYILTENGDIYLVECSNRGGGVFISSVIVPQISGINTNLILVNESLGIEKEFDPGRFQHKSQCLVLGFYSFDSHRRLKKLSFEKVLSKSFVLRLQSSVKAGDELPLIKNGAQRHLILLIQGDNLKEAKANLDEAINAIEVSYD